jgi:D-alanyl-D-alanine carboxypeptidase
MMHPTHPTTVTSPDTRVPAELDARLTAVLDRVVARRGIHHAMLAVSSGDGTRHWSGAAGPAGSDETPLRPDTPFFIASVTKRFIVTLVLQAHERRELHLDDRIVDHLPPEVTRGLHVLKGVDHTPTITIRHLLSHTSGLPDHFERVRRGPSLYQRLARGEDLAWSLEDVIRTTREDQAPHFAPQDLTAPRQRARYSDTGFQLLIAIVERAAGASFGALLTERILVPLGLTHTWLPGRTDPASPTATPAQLFAKDRPLELPRMVVSSNDLASTTEDLLRFQRALLAGELFSRPATVGLLTERENLLRNAFPLRYGLGTMVFRVGRINAPGREPATLVGHAGATGTWLFHCPELDVHLAGTVDQGKGQRTPFGIMVRILRAWEA